MRVSCDDDFLAGQAFAGMPFGINGDFDGWRRPPIRLDESIAKFRAFAKQRQKAKAINHPPSRRLRMAQKMAQGCH
jgi:hypothetical protein